ncbi:hypothetical protein EHO61_13675 [Leptospira fluminis]|uniref:Glycosyltransferase RgtA/B/C/D-like domain-containing protein n=2 Tax=Leptospira fluminis TaxID=2484979 RepID=A0A4R9GMV9_9LEPT|nr:hypothetical protein EHO61_13675 [Leptospira fluminis]
MFRAALRRLISLTDSKKGFVLFGASFLALFLTWQYQTGIRVGDGAIKQQQVADLLVQGFPDFSCRYFGKDFDPTFRFLPMTIEKGDTMAHSYRGKCYYVFPFYYAAVQAPLALLFGRVGSFILSLISSLVCLAFLYEISKELDFRNGTRFFFILFLLVGSTFSLFSTDMSEYILSMAGVTAGLYYLLRTEKEKGRETKDAILAGISFGLAALFRQEVVLLAASLTFSQVLFMPKRFRLLWFPAVFGVLFLLQAAINDTVVGHPFGSRGYLQSFSPKEFDPWAQLSFFWELIAFGHGSIGLFGAYPILLFTWKSTLKDSKIRTVFVGILFFILLSAALTSPKFWQGVLFGPRFLLTVTPILLLFAFHSLESVDIAGSKLLKVMAAVAIGFSVLGVCTYDVMYHKFTKSIVLENSELDSFAEKAVVYRRGSAMFPPNSFRTERMIFELPDEAEFDVLLTGLYGSGIRRFTVVGAKDAYPKEKLVPKSNRFEISEISFHKSPSIHLETVEIRPIPNRADLETLHESR